MAAIKQTPSTAVRVTIRSTAKGNDTLTGGIGDDTLDGGAGDDTYVFNSGDGQDTVLDVTRSVFRFAPDISPEFLHLGQSLGDDGSQYLTIVYGDDDQLSIQNGLFDFGQTYDFNGTVLTQREMLQYAPGLVTLGTDSADTLYGSNQADTLIGNNGDDTIEGQKGDDNLEGGLGFDTYIYNFGDGADTILDTDGLGKIIYRDAQGMEYILGASASGEGGRFTYGVNETTHTLTVVLDGQDALTIENYYPFLNLGIEPTYQTPEVPSGPLEPIRRVSVAADGIQGKLSQFLSAPFG